MPVDYRMTSNQVDFYLSEIKSCEERKRKDLLERNCYPYLIKYYEGLMYPDQNTSDDEKFSKKLAFVNEYFPNINALIAEIMFRNPDIMAEATKPEAEEGAPIMQSALTYGFKKLDALTENKVALFDMIVAGYCAVEVNHINRSNVEQEPMTLPNQQPRSVVGRVTDALGITKSETPKELEEDLQREIPTKEVAYSTPDETYIRRWEPLDVGFDYRASRLKDCRYLYKIIRMTPAEFNVRYPELKDKVEAGGDLIPYTQHQKSDDKKLIVLYEIQLRKDDDKYVNFVISPTFKFHEIDYFDRPYTTNGFNLKIGTLHEYGKLYPISFARINKSLQDDLNNYVTFMMEVAERNIPKRGVNSRKVKEDGVAALNSNKVNAVVEGLDLNANDIFTIQNTNVSNENKELMQLFQQHKDKLWSVSQERLGQKSDAQFMGQIEIQEAGFQARQSDIQEGLRKLMLSELDTLKDIIVQYWDGPMFFKITGSDKPQWYMPQIDPISGMVLNPLTDILKGDYEISIDISTALKPNKERS